MRLLALHGRYQSASRFAEKLAGCKLAKGGMDFTNAGPITAASAPTSYSSSQDPELSTQDLDDETSLENSNATTMVSSTRVRVDQVERTVHRFGNVSSETENNLKNDSKESIIQVDRGLVEVEFISGEKIELIALESPHEVEAQVNLGANKSLRRKPARPRGTPCSTRAWWYGEDDDPSAGLETSVEVVAKALEEFGPFDGVLGYSQGASLVGLLSSEEFQKKHNLKFDISIVCSGYPFKGADLRVAKGHRSLHVFSELDRMIYAERSRELARVMGGVTVQHEKGHVLPVPWVYDQIYNTFFRS